MTHRAKITAVCATLLVLCMGVSVLLLVRIDRMRRSPGGDEMLYLPSATLVRKLSLGYTGLAADIYWTRVVQYFGERHRTHATDYPLLGSLLEITTDLDPKLTIAYQFGASFLGQKPPQGAGMPERAVALVNKGIRANPNDWRLYSALGFLEYIERQDYLAAARAFDQGSKIPGAHPSLKVLAAAMAQHGGDRETARLLWTSIYDTTQDSLIRQNALEHLRALKSDEDVSQLEQLLQRYAQRTGYLPSSFMELAAAGWLRGIPVDPVGSPYKLAANGRVEVEDPDQLPFITKGLPPGTKPSILGIPQPKH